MTPDDLVVMFLTLWMAAMMYHMPNRQVSDDAMGGMPLAATMTTVLAVSHAAGVARPEYDGRLGGLMAEVLVLAFAVCQRRNEGLPFRTGYSIWVLAWGSFACLVAVI